MFTLFKHVKIDSKPYTGLADELFGTFITWNVTPSFSHSEHFRISNKPPVLPGIMGSASNVWVQAVSEVLCLMLCDVVLRYFVQQDDEWKSRKFALKSAAGTDSKWLTIEWWMSLLFPMARIASILSAHTLDYCVDNPTPILAFSRQQNYVATLFSEVFYRTMFHKI